MSPHSPPPHGVQSLESNKPIPCWCLPIPEQPAQLPPHLHPAAERSPVPDVQGEKAREYPVSPMGHTVREIYILSPCCFASYRSDAFF
jgi:hypothetical protein